MLIGPEWTQEDIAYERVVTPLTSIGRIVERNSNHEFVVENIRGYNKLSFSESVLWYCSSFDALSYYDLYRRYKKIERNLNVKLDDYDSVAGKMSRDRTIAVGVELNREDALFTMFCSGFPRIVLDGEALDYGYRNGYTLDDKYYNWTEVEQTSKQTPPITVAERIFLDMINTEGWTISEITRNFVKGYDTHITRKEVPNEKFKMLSLDPKVSLIRLNYERHPMARTVASTALSLLKKRKIIIF